VKSRWTKKRVWNNEQGESACCGAQQCIPGKGDNRILEFDNFDERRECANEKIEDYRQHELEKRFLKPILKTETVAQGADRPLSLASEFGLL
jgi:hypothetical protein